MASIKELFSRYMNRWPDDFKKGYDRGLKKAGDDSRKVTDQNLENVLNELTGNVRLLSKKDYNYSSLGYSFGYWIGLRNSNVGLNLVLGNEDVTGTYIRNAKLLKARLDGVVPGRNLFDGVLSGFNYYRPDAFSVKNYERLISEIQKLD